MNFDALPKEILNHIFSFADFLPLCSLFLTCKRFNQILQQETQWKVLCEEKWQLDRDMRTVIEKSKALDPTKGYQWFARCLHLAPKGLYHCNGAHIGKIELKGPEAVVFGWGVEYRTGILRIGSFYGAKELPKYMWRVHSGLKWGYQDDGRFTYTGDFNRKLQYEGEGEHVDVERGLTYRGGLQAGRRHGKGRLEYPNGFAIESTWTSGQPISGTFCSR